MLILRNSMFKMVENHVARQGSRGTSRNTRAMSQAADVGPGNLTADPASTNGRMRGDARTFCDSKP